MLSSLSVCESVRRGTDREGGSDLNGPGFDFVFPRREEVNELKGAIAGHNDLIQGTKKQIKSTSRTYDELLLLR